MNHAPTTDHDAPLLLEDGRLERLRDEVEGVRAPQFRRLLEECERYRTVVLPTEHPSASITYFGPAAANLALAYRITGHQHYLEELRRWLAPPLSFAHWGKAHMPDHDLDAGWLCHGLGLAYAWAGDALPEDERSALADKLLLQGRRLYEFAVESEGDWWSSSYWQNHNWICYAGLATAGYVLADVSPETKDWTERAKANFREVIRLLPEDGSNCEGVVYWRYGVPWLVSYLDVLEAAEGIDLFAESDYLRETFWYRLYQAAPDLERIIDHGDCHDRRSGHSVSMYYKLASKYRIGQAQWLADQVTGRFFWREAYESGVRPGVRPEAYQELLWFDPTVVPEDPQSLPLTRFFPDLGLVVGRTSWERDASMVSFKAAPGGGHKAWSTSHETKRTTGWTTLNAGHHHPDAGTFVLLGHGEYLAVDEGYSNQKRHGHHNGILVDGQGYANEGRYHVYKDVDERHVARIRSTSLGGGWTCATSESGAMYADELGVVRVDRHLVMSPRGTVVLVDDLASDEPRSWSWLLQSDNPWTNPVAGTHETATGRAHLRVSALGPDDCTVGSRPTVVHANPTASSPELAIERTLHTLSRATAATTDALFVTVLEPLLWTDHEASEVSVHRTAGGLVVDVRRAGVLERVAVSLDGSDPSAVLGEPGDVTGPEIAAVSVGDSHGGAPR